MLSVLSQELPAADKIMILGQFWWAFGDSGQLQGCSFVPRLGARAGPGGASVRRGRHPTCASQDPDASHLNISPDGMPGGAAGPALPLPELCTHTWYLGLSLCSNAFHTPVSFPLLH